jgi:hypothetical protein
MNSSSSFFDPNLLKTPINTAAFTPGAAGSFPSFADSISAGQNAFGTGGFSGNNSNSGGNFFSNFLGGLGGNAGRNLTTGVLGGINTGLALDAANRTTDAALATARGQLAFADQARKEATLAQLANNALNIDAQFGFGANANFARASAADRERRERNFADTLRTAEFANTPEAREAQRFQNRLAIQRDVAGRIAQSRAMFGSSTPLDNAILFS